MLFCSVLRPASTRPLGSMRSFPIRRETVTSPSELAHFKTIRSGFKIRLPALRPSFTTPPGSIILPPGSKRLGTILTAAPTPPSVTRRFKTMSPGGNNTAVGDLALFHSTGDSNTAIGDSAGFNLTSGNNNVYVNNPGVASESGTIRIGTVGTQTKAFVAGITGVAVTGATVLVSGTGQLGVAAS